MGLTGPVEIWDGTRAFPRMCSIVEAASGLTVQENDEVSARFVKCRPFVMCAEAASGGVRGGLTWAAGDGPTPGLSLHRTPSSGIPEGQGGIIPSRSQR